MNDQNQYFNQSTDALHQANTGQNDVVRLQAEIAVLKKENAELNLIINGINECIYSRDVVNNRYINMSAGCEKVYGYSFEEFVANTSLWYDVIYPSDVAKVAYEEDALQKGEAITSVYRIIHKDESLRWVEVKAIGVIKNGILIKVDGVVNDITERKVTELRLKESEKVLNEAQRIARLGSWTIDLNTNNCVWSNEMYRIFAIDKSKFLGACGEVMALIHPEDRYKVLRNFKRGIRQNILHRIITPHGETKYVIENWESFFAIDGTVIQVVGTTQDITEKFLAEQTARETEQRYKQIVETAQEGIWLIDENDCTNFVNKKMAEMLEYTVDELMGEKIYMFNDETYRQKSYLQIEQRKLGISENHLSRFITKTGRYIWVSISTNPVFNDRGQYKGALAMITDITHQKEGEEILHKHFVALQDAYTQQTSILNALPANIALLDKEGKIMTVNDGWKNFAQSSYKYDHDFWVGANYIKIAENSTGIDSEYGHQTAAGIKEVISGAQPEFSMEYPCKTPSGMIWFNLLVSPLSTVENNGAVVLHQNITDKKQAETERESVIKELIKSNADLKQFSFITSHNLRAPLSNIVGILNIIDYEALDNMNKEMLQMLNVSANQLSKTIDDLTSILIIKNNLNVVLVNINLKNLLDEVLKTFIIAVEKVNGQIITDFEVSEIYFYQIYLESILINLISNSIKYKSPVRNLIINISNAYDDKGNCVMQFSDNGIGINLTRHKDKVFGLYQRFNNEAEGQGLGLYIIKSQLVALGGSISVHSEVDKGTTFTLTFKSRKFMQHAFAKEIS